MTEEATMDKLRDTLFAKLAAACVPLSLPLKSLIHRRFRDFAPFFRVPDHPPYASMIREAIQKLGEESGSSEEAISEFIVSGYKDLPLAHNLMLGHHLWKLSRGGEIVLSSHTGRYMLPCKHNKVRRRRGRADENQLVVGGGIEKEHKLKKRKGIGLHVAEQGLEAITQSQIEEAFNLGVEVMTETRGIQMPNAESSEEDKSSNEASRNNQADAEVSEEAYVAEKQPCEVAEKQHESQDLHVDVTGKQLQLQTKGSDKYFEGHGHKKSLIESGKHQEEQNEVSEIMQVYPMMTQSWCQDARCAIELENLKLEVAKRFKSQSIFAMELKQLMEDVTNMKRDMQEVDASGKEQVDIDGELVMLKKTCIELLEKTKKAQKRLMEISISTSKNDHLARL